MSPAKERALAALLINPNREQAARAAGVTTRTLYNFFQDPEFQRRYKQAFKNVVEDSTRTAQRMMTPALATLRSVMRDDTQPGSVRVMASRAALDTALKMTAQVDMADRLEAIEARLDAAEGTDDYNRKA